MRHTQWNDVIQFLYQIIDKHGSIIYDYRCGKCWDAGQAICAEAYGPEWAKSRAFLEWSQRDESEPPEPHYYACAKAMADGYTPDWMIEPD